MLKKYLLILLSALLALIPGCTCTRKEGEPDVVSSMSLNRNERLTVVANRNKIGDREEFAWLLIEKYLENSFQTIHFSTDIGYATSLNMRVFLWADEIEDNDPEMIIEYIPVEWGAGYDVYHDSEMFLLYIDGKLVPADMTN